MLFCYLYESPSGVVLHDASVLEHEVLRVCVVPNHEVASADVLVSKQLHVAALLHLNIHGPKPHVCLRCRRTKISFAVLFRIQRARVAIQKAFVDNPFGPNECLLGR